MVFAIADAVILDRIVLVDVTIKPETMRNIFACQRANVL